MRLIRAYAIAVALTTTAPLPTTLATTAQAAALEPAFDAPPAAALSLIPRFPVAKTNVKAAADDPVNAGQTADVWYPEAIADFPVIAFVGGLGGAIPADVYSDLIAQVVAQGVIVVVPTSQLRLPTEFNERGADLAKMINWLAGGLTPALAAASPQLPPRADVAGSLLLLGHSSGAQAVIAANRHLTGKVAGFILLDPVDGAPFGDAPHAIDPGETLKLAPPLLLLSAGLCKEKGWDQKWYPACCPEGVSAAHFYDYFTGGPKWWVTALDYGHADLLDDAFAGIVAATRFCRAAAPQFDKAPYRDWLATWIAGFATAGSKGLPGFPPVLDPEARRVNSVSTTNPLF